MNEKDLFESMNEMDEELLERSEQNKNRKEKRQGRSGKGARIRWQKMIAAVLVLVITCGVLFWPETGSGQNPEGGSNRFPLDSDIILPGDTTPGITNACAIAMPEYPEMVKCPQEVDYWDKETENFDYDAYSADQEAWLQSIEKLRKKSSYGEKLDSFFRTSLPFFLSQEKGQNVACSPLNVFMAMSMTAELTDGNSRKQILDTIGVESLEELRTLAGEVWERHYRNDGATTSILASSLWLNEDISYVSRTMTNLAEYYYASSYTGEMGSEDYNKLFRKWLNEQTGGLLQEQIEELEFHDETVMGLATTIYFRAAWGKEFSERLTKPAVFHGTEGDVEWDFMNDYSVRNYYWGEKFDAIELSLEHWSGSMWLILPDEGVTPEDLLKNEEAMDFLASNGDWDRQKWLKVNLSVPKFDITSQMEMTEQWKALGIEDIFHETVSDFSPMTKDLDEIFVSRIQHDVRVAIDEKGVTATGYTVALKDAGAAPPEEEVDFILDRPFLFSIMSNDGLPLFAGMVNQLK